MATTSFACPECRLEAFSQDLKYLTPDEAARVCSAIYKRGE